MCNDFVELVNAGSGASIAAPRIARYNIPVAAKHELQPLRWPAAAHPFKGSFRHTIGFPLTVLGGAMAVWRGSYALLPGALIVWATLTFLYHRRMRPIHSAITQQLELRPSFPSEAWQTPQTADLANRVARIIANEIGWPNGYFLPDDPLEILFFAPFGDGGEGLAIFTEIESNIGCTVRITPSLKHDQATFADLIGSIRVTATGRIGCSSS